MKKNELLVIFGENLRFERFRRNLSQEKLAEMVGLSSPNHIGKIERAEINPTLTTISAILKALNLKFEDLSIKK